MNIFLKNISKEFRSIRGSHTAVDDVSLTINDKEFFVLLGPSGCGKSTTLNLIAGLEKPTGGELYFDDTCIASAQSKMFRSARERNIAMVFQNYALYPHLSVYENIAFPLKIEKMDKQKIDESVRKTADILHLNRLLNSQPQELSGGERQRVAIARAIVRQPSIFLLDEPLSNLDAQLRASTRTELKRLQRDLQITTVYVTHDQTEAMTLGDRIAVLRNGTIEQIGTPDDLYDQPANTFVASFIGSPPINLIEGELRKENGSWVFTSQLFSYRFSPDDDRFGTVTDSSCIFAIRPEHISVSTEKQSDQSFRGRLFAVENLGKDCVLHISRNDVSVVAVTHNKEFEENSDIFFSIDEQQVHLFNQ